ncbi:hypothetical protein F4Z98_16480 [Candidatus Poribacteria bacterium]|nr:hypothetical protein [Candidatus Poribacteria bacterium]MYC40239.1 hypothetical protein [Candidatus Dadabacteria bacterium]
MNKDIQSQLDARISSRRAAQVVEASDLPTFTPDIFDHDERETALVEVNFREMSARVVEASDAPKITRDVLETLGKPIKTVELFFEDSFFQVSVRDGIPLELEIQQLRLMTEYADREKDPVVKEERNIELSRLLLSGMIVDPQFSYRGRGEGIPIETRSRVMLDSFAEAFSVVNQLETDAIYQVTVRRGVPADAFAITGGETFEFYPVGKQKKYLEMSSEELSAEMVRNTARRRALVPAMIVDPQLSYTEDIGVENPSHGSDENVPYPVGLLSERFLRTFFEAHRVVNVPAAGVASLRRFLRASGDTSTSENSDGEPVRNVQGTGDNARG